MNISKFSPENFTARLYVKCHTYSDKKEKYHDINPENISSIDVSNDTAVIRPHFGDIYHINMNDKNSPYTPQLILSTINTAKNGIDVTI